VTTTQLHQMAEKAASAANALYALIMEHNLDRDPEIRAKLLDCHADYPQSLRHAVDAVNILGIAIEDRILARTKDARAARLNEWFSGYGDSEEGRHG
jgi:hypothetical protein